MAIKKATVVPTTKGTEVTQADEPKNVVSEAVAATPVEPQVEVPTTDETSTEPTTEADSEVTTPEDDTPEVPTEATPPEADSETAPEGDQEESEDLTEEPKVSSPTKQLVSVTNLRKTFFYQPSTGFRIGSLETKDMLDDSWLEMQIGAGLLKRAD